MPDLEVQVQDVVLMEVVHARADLLGEQDHIQLGQVALLVCDPVEELASSHAAKAKGGPGRSAPGPKHGPTRVSPLSSGLVRGPPLWPAPAQSAAGKREVAGRRGARDRHLCWSSRLALDVPGRGCKLVFPQGNVGTYLARTPAGKIDPFPAGSFTSARTAR